MKYLSILILSLFLSACGSRLALEDVTLVEANATCEANAAFNILGVEASVSVYPTCTESVCSVEVCVNVAGLVRCELVESQLKDGSAEGSGDVAEGSM